MTTLAHQTLQFQAETAARLLEAWQPTANFVPTAKTTRKRTAAN